MILYCRGPHELSVHPWCAHHCCISVQHHQCRLSVPINAAYQCP
ncbi:unnamed protein product, partial [Staurois parvus]